MSPDSLQNFNLQSNTSSSLSVKKLFPGTLLTAHVQDYFFFFFEKKAHLSFHAKVPCPFLFVYLVSQVAALRVWVAVYYLTETGQYQLYT